MPRKIDNTPPTSQRLDGFHCYALAMKFSQERQEDIKVTVTNNHVNNQTGNSNHNAPRIRR